MREFLVDIVTTVPEGTPGDEVTQRRSAEARAIKQLAAQRRVLRLWRTADGLRTIGLWRAHDETDLHASVLDTLPLRPWMTLTVTATAPHPNDPGLLTG